MYMLWLINMCVVLYLVFGINCINIIVMSGTATLIENHLLKQFNVLKKIGSGAYGHVWKVQQKQTKRIYALKKIFDAFQHSTDAQRTYREIEILKQLNHPNIIKLHDTIRADNNKDVYLLFEYMQADLHNVISEGILKEVHIKFIIYQIAKALKYMHSGALIHRDLKPSNVLVNSNCSIKLCDFGLVRSLNSVTNNRAILTEGVATRWYRAPEVLLGSRCYSTPADVWSFGCIVYQILAQKPLFPGSSTIDQLQKICQFTGLPSEEDIASIDSQVARSMIKQVKVASNSKAQNFLKEFPAPFADVLEGMLAFNPAKRITVEQLLAHQLVQAFHKPQEEVCCQRLISTSIDDNRKFSVEQYRKLVYGQNNPRSKVLSSSFGSGKHMGSSVKMVSAALNRTTLQTSSSSHAINRTTYSQSEQTGKKPVQKYRTTTIQTTYVKGTDLQKKYQRPVLKYVRSAKDISKNIQNISHTTYNKHTQNNTQVTYSKLSNHPSLVQKKEESAAQVRKTSSSGHLAPKTYFNRSGENKTANSGGGVNVEGKAGVSVGLLQCGKESDKTGLLKTGKYINMGKGQSYVGAVSSLLQKPVVQ